MKINTSYPKRNSEGFAALLVVGVVVLAVVGGVYLYQSGTIKIPGLTPTPTEEPRLNPAPTTGYALTVAEVTPGAQVTVDSVEMKEDGYVAVLLDVAGDNDTVLGKSALLTAGVHEKVLINLSKPTKDGDVIYIRLQDKAGKSIVTENNTNIEVFKSIGDTMIHYDNEY